MKITTKVAIAVCALAFMHMARSPITVTLGAMQEAYPDVSATTIQLVLTVAAAAVIVSSLLLGPLCLKFSKKTLGIAGLLGILIGGVAVFWTTNLTWIFIWRIVLGLGLGIVMPISAAIAADYLKGKDYDMLIGRQQVFACIGMIVMSMGCGYLANMGWHYGYLIHLIAIIPLILIIVMLPKRPPEQLAETAVPKTEATAPKAEKKKIKLTGKLWYLVFIFILYFIFFDAFGENMGMFLTYNKLGQPSDAGIIQSIFVVGGLLVSLAFGHIFTKLKEYTVPVAVCVTGIGFFIFYSSYSLTMCLVSAFVIGVGLNCAVSSSYALGRISVAQIAVPTALGFINVGVHIGQFVAPLIINPMANLMGPVDLAANFRFRWAMVGVVLFIIAIITLIAAATRKKKFGTIDEQLAAK